MDQLMNNNWKNRVLHVVGALTMVFMLAFLPIVKVGAAALNSTEAETGYIDYTYGTAVKPLPTADTPESKLWFADGRWWAIMFNPTSVKFEIYRLDWATQDWVTTNVDVDSRNETSGGVPSGKVDTRHDVLWDEAAGKLYISSHIQLLNPSKVTSSENWGWMSRYSYDSVAHSYTLDPNFPVTVNKDKTASLVMEKDSSGRLWVAYVSRVPTSPPAPPAPYNVYVNSSTGDDATWGTPINLADSIATLGEAAVDQLDLVSVIAYGNKIGVMWSNDLTDYFYFAEHPDSSAPGADWTVTAISVAGVPLSANDHINLVANSAGQVFAAVKTHNTDPNDALIGLLARETTGTWVFREFSKLPSNDTHPSLVLNESTDTLYMFATSEVNGGVICYKTLAATALVANLGQFSTDHCSATNANRAPIFIQSSVHPNAGFFTSTKQNVTSASGLVGLASDDVNGSVYLHNYLSSPKPMVIDYTPANGATVTANSVEITVTFDQSIDEITLTPANFVVTGPNGVLTGTITYDDLTRTATFTADNSMLNPGSNAITVALSTGIKSTTGGHLYSAVNWAFTLDNAMPKVINYSPADGVTVTSDTVEITATFDQSMDPATIIPANFIVTGPNGVLTGTLTYDDLTRTATFTANSAMLNAGSNAISVQLTTGITNTTGGSLENDVMWAFVQVVTSTKIHIYLPMIVNDSAN